MADGPAKPQPPSRRKPSAVSRRRGAQKLTPQEKELARDRAGRLYPNLVDNMWGLGQRRKRHDHPAG